MITIFRNVREISTPYFITLDKVIERIRTGHSQGLLTQIRAEKDKKRKQELKTGLPSILFSGDFPNRKRDAIPKNHSGLIILDIDELGDKTMEQVGEIIKADKYTHSAFVSPSGNGYKCLVKIPADIKRHVGYYLGLEDYYLNEYKIKLDPTGKNIGRVCYESFDPDVYFCEESEVFKHYIEPLKSIPKANNKGLDVFSITSDDEIINRLTAWWAKNYDFNSGRNHAIYQLASSFNRYGISHSAAISHCNKYADYSRPKDPFDTKEIERIVNNVYSQQTNKHGSEKMEDSKKRQSIVDEILASEPDHVVDMLGEVQGFEDFSPTELEEAAIEIKEEAKKEKKSTRLFWSYDDGKLKIDIKTLMVYINDLGYYLYYPSKTPNSYILIKVDNNIIKPVDERQIKQDVLDFVDSKKQNAVYNILSDRVKYWTKSFLNALPVFDPPILRDSRHISFIPTPSGVYKITKDNIVKIDYIDLTEGYVWESQITKKDFNFLGSEKAAEGDFAKFVSLVGGEKAARLYTIIGYLLHNFKDPALSKAVFLYDKNLSQIDGEPEGGSGKSLLIEAMKKIREVAAMPGDRVDFSRSFVFQELSESTQVAWVDELPQNIDIHKFFSRITNGIPVEKKNQQPIYIENDVAPKFVFTTNFKPKGSSGSHARRRIDFSVTNFFNEKNDPRKMFGKSFFTEWDDYEYNLFFTFYLECLKEYLSSGIIKIDDKDDLYLTLISECGVEFTQFFIDDGKLNEIIEIGTFNVRDYYNKLVAVYELRSNDLSVKEYLHCIRKILKLHSIKYTEEGKRTELVFTIIK